MLSALQKRYTETSRFPLQTPQLRKITADAQVTQNKQQTNSSPSAPSPVLPPAGGSGSADASESPVAPIATLNTFHSCLPKPEPYWRNEFEPQKAIFRPKHRRILRARRGHIVPLRVFNGEAKLWTEDGAGSFYLVNHSLFLWHAGRLKKQRERECGWRWMRSRRKRRRKERAQ